MVLHSIAPDNHPSLEWRVAGQKLCFKFIGLHSTFLSNLAKTSESEMQSTFLPSDLLTIYWCTQIGTSLHIAIASISDICIKNMEAK